MCRGFHPENVIHRHVAQKVIMQTENPLLITFLRVYLLVDCPRKKLLKGLT